MAIIDKKPKALKPLPSKFKTFIFSFFRKLILFSIIITSFFVTFEFSGSIFVSLWVPLFFLLAFSGGKKSKHASTLKNNNEDIDNIEEMENFLFLTPGNEHLLSMDDCSVSDEELEEMGLL